MLNIKQKIDQTRSFQSNMFQTGKLVNLFEPETYRDIYKSNPNLDNTNNKIIIRTRKFEQIK